MPKAKPTVDLPVEFGEGGTVQADPASEIPGTSEEADASAEVSVRVLRNGPWGKAGDKRTLPWTWLQSAVDAGEVQAV